MGAREDRKQRLEKTHEFLLKLLEKGPVDVKFIKNWMVWVFGISKRYAIEEIETIIEFRGLKYEKGIIEKWTEANKEEETEK